MITAEPLAIQQESEPQARLTAPFSPIVRKCTYAVWRFNTLRPSEMCRNIKTLFNFDPPVTAEEIQAASLQFVRKISGFNKPSRANEASFLAAVDEIAAVSSRFIHSLETNAPPRNREEETTKAKARAAARFGD